MNNSSRLTTIINYLFVFLTINYRLIVNFITHVDSAGYGIIALSILVFVLNAKDFNLLQLNKPIVFWLVWCVYAFLNYYTHPHIHNQMGVLELYRKIFIPLIVMTVVAKEYVDDPDRTLWLCFITHAIYMLLGYYYDRGILYRIDDEENVLGNAYAIISSFTLFYLVLLNRKNKINTFWFIILAVVIMIVLAMSGTRKAFGAGVIYLVFWLLSVLELKKVWSWILVAAFLWAGIWGYNQLMENTYIGQRMEYLEEQQEDFLPSDAPKILGVFGDRSGHYYYGWLLFLKHPLFGVGTGQTHIDQGLYVQVYTHTEYIAQLTDQGLFGFVLFALFYCWIVVNLFKQFRNDNSVGKCMLGGMVAILFLSLTVWTWEFPRYFICLGVLIGFCNTTDDLEEDVEESEEEEELEIEV